MGHYFLDILYFIDTQYIVNKQNVCFISIYIFYVHMVHINCRLNKFMCFMLLKNKIS